MINKKVKAVYGVAQGEENGEIIAEEKNQFGYFYKIQWEDGNQELITQHSLKSQSEDGVGVYVQ